MEVRRRLASVRGGGLCRRPPDRLRRRYGRRCEDAPFFTRGVLLECTRVTGSRLLPRDSPIGRRRDGRICAAEGVTVEPWDVVLIRTGYMGLCRTPKRMARAQTAAGHLAAPVAPAARCRRTGTDPRHRKCSLPPIRGQRAIPSTSTLCCSSTTAFNHGEPRPRAPRSRPCLRVPVRCSATQDPRRHGLDGRSLAIV